VDNFININQLEKSELEDILSISFYFQENFKNNNISIFKNSNVIFLFLEPSTRTKTSFKIACSILGINPIDVSPENSSITKGESIENTLNTLNSYPVDAIVMRSKNQEDFKIAQKILNFPVINAGSGTDSHPTQALSDLKTLKENFNDFKNLKVSIVGDLLHSRVANSFIEAFGKYNLKTNLFSPPYFKPKKMDFDKVIFYENFDECLNNSDVVMALRVQKERFKNLKIDLNEYASKYQLNQEKLDQHSIKFLMHPGPVNEGVEISNGLQNSKKSLIGDQVKNGVWVRCAILSKILKGNKK
jgi:aspartate carbamoyltransferase catalytic subunit